MAQLMLRQIMHDLPSDAVRTNGQSASGDENRSR
jgi:hypothetical protein